MKLLLLISFLFSLAFSYDTRIVIGCFKEEINAKNEKINIDYSIRHDKKFQTFLDINSIQTKYKLIDGYYVLSFEPFSEIAVRKAVYNKIKKRYPDAYIIDITPQDEINNSQLKVPTKQEEVVKTIEDKPSVQHDAAQDVEENDSAENDPVLATEPDVEDIKVPKYDEVKAKPETTQPAPAVEKEMKVTPTQKEESSGSIVDYLIEIILFIIVMIAILVYFLRKNSQQMNENELFGNTENSNLENIVINEIDPQEYPFEEEDFDTEEDEYAQEDDEEIQDEEYAQDENDETVVLVEENAGAIDLTNVEFDEQEEEIDENSSEEESTKK